MDNKRTPQQNKALHLYFKLLSDAFIENNLDVKTVLSGGVETQFTPEIVKYLLWHTVQRNVLGKDSTAKLDKKEIDIIYNSINKYIGQEFGIYVPFPSIDDLINYEVHH